MKNPNIPVSWRQTIEQFVPGDEREEAEKLEMLALIEREGDRILTRKCTFAHMTASSIVVNADRTQTLMAYHKIYDSWAWTGGHADGDGDFEAVARRETAEETGVYGLKLLHEGPASLEILPVWAHIKRGKWVGSHLHLNVSYLFEADDTLPVRIAEDENSAVSWIPLAELDRMVSEPTMLPIYKRLLRRVNDC